ncbi:MAG: leucine-rich repeat protein, partial [Clostridia bacterium]|nr:leucine-rich repeat protein [Clostridia bacterium]
MKKRILIFLAVLVVLISAITVMATTASADEKKITVSYMNSHNPFHPDAGFDKTAYENGQQVVAAGEEFTLPTASNAGYAEDGYQLRWYTHDGRSYKGGETVSFTEDTRLYRAAAKEVYSFSQLNEAMTSNSHAVVLMNDIYAEGEQIQIWGQNHAILDLGGYTLTVSRNGTIMGGQRSANVVIGKGTLKAVNPDNKIGSYTVFDCKGHGYNGDEGETLIGRDVKIDAPNFFLCYDYEGNHVPGYPYIKICGAIDVQFVLNRSNGENSARIDFMETCDVTLRGEYFNVDYKAPTDTVVYNKRAFDITIYGGLFNLPAEAANEIYWSTDNLATENELTYANKDEISILGGIFVLPDGAKPAIDKFLTKSHMMMLTDSHDGMPLANLMAGKSDTTAFVHYLMTGGYKFAFKKNGSLIVTDNVGTGLGGTYYYTINPTSDGTAIETVSLFTDEAKTTPTDAFEIKRGDSAKTLFVSFGELKEGKATNTTVVSSYGITAVVSKDCQHSYEPTEAIEATCIAYASQSYKCSVCGDEYTASYGKYAACKWELVSDTQPTSTTPGVKLYTCTVCGESMEETYYLDITNESIDVVVTGNKTVSVKVSALFNLERIGDNMYVLTGIKPFGEYTLEDIIEINVPMGISSVNIADSNASVLKMNIMDGATVSLTSFAKLSALTEITIGKANVTFESSCANNSIQKIDSSVAGASVKFSSNVFKGKLSITDLCLSSGSSYDFQVSSFHGSGLKEVILPDNCEVSWGKTAFAECQKLEYVYIGSNIGVTQIANDSAIFDGVSNLKKVVIMDLTYLGQWAFSTKNPGANFGPLCDLTMYIHSESLTMNSNCLNNRNKDYNVYIYTVQNALPSAINNCNYTIYKGVPHMLSAGYDAPTCTEDGANGYVTDCPCGAQLSGALEVQKYVNSVKDFETVTYQSEIIPATGHKEGEIIGIAYADGYMSAGVKTYICAVCSEEFSDEAPSAEALFEFLGYSMPEDGELVLTIGFAVNSKAVEAYEKANNTKLEYGAVCAISEKLDGKAPLDSTLTGVSIVKAPVDKTYGAFNFVLSGFTDELLD